jgi:hypothetical protein
LFLAVIAYVVWHSLYSASAPAPAAGPVPGPPPAVAPIAKKPVDPSASAFVTPSRASESDKFEALDVLVRRASAGAVTVKILDASGRTVRNLYAGSVPGGLWRFPWNGCLNDGTIANAGSYMIEVGTSSGVQRRTVVLKSESTDPVSK